MKKSSQTDVKVLVITLVIIILLFAAGFFPDVALWRQIGMAILVGGILWWLVGSVVSYFINED